MTSSSPLCAPRVQAQFSVRASKRHSEEQLETTLVLPAKALIALHFFPRKWAEATARHKLQAFTLAVMPAKAGNQYLELD
jgi:hypothetical protein